MAAATLIADWVPLGRDGAWLLAQGGGEGPGLIGFLPPLVLIALFYLLFMRPQQKKQQAYRSMVEGLKEHDRIVTVGGIYGTVTNVQRSDERVTIRVDDATGTKLKVGIWAISEVLGDKGGRNSSAASSSSTSSNKTTSGAK